MSNIFYPRTVEVSGNLSGNGVYPNNIVLKDNISLSSITASTGISASLIYGDGNNIKNLNPDNIDFSGLLSDISSSFGQSANISASFGLKTDISSSFARLLKTESQTFSGPITASSFLANNNSKVIGNLEVSSSTDAQLLSVYHNDDVYLRINDGTADTLLGVKTGVGFTGTGTAHDFKIRTSNTPRITVKADGKVGIGTTSPTTLLSIGTTPQTALNDNELLQLSNTAADDAYMTARSNQAVAFFGAYQDNAFVGSQTEDRFVLTSNNRTRMCIAADGKVGVGTDFINPDELLHISGNLKVNNDVKITGSCYLGTEVYTDLYDIPQKRHLFEVQSNTVADEPGSIIAKTDLTMSGSILMNSGEGIKFGETAGNITDTLLDDYEEGTWTPTATNWNFTVNEYDAKYIKVGSMVNVWCSISASSDQDLNNAAASIGGLPFVPTSTTAAFINCLKNNPATDSSQNTLSAVIYSGGSYIEINTDPTTGHRYYYVFASYRV